MAAVAPPSTLNTDTPVAPILKDTPPSALSQVIAELTSAYPGSVHRPHDPTYAEHNTYWSANVIQTPPAIFTPPTPLATAHALQTLSAHSIPFAIRSGGHSPNRDFASSPSFILNLSTLSTLSLSADRRTVRIGTGNRWRDVYAFLEQHGLTCAGGRVGSVGVGGFLVGGGISFGVGRHGFSAEHVEAYTVALADGRVVRATAAEHAGLFRALKGSGAPFCCVVEFEVRTEALGRGWGGVVDSDEGSVPGALEEAWRFLYHGVDDEAAHLIASILHVPDQEGGRMRCVNQTLFHADFAGEGVPAVFEGVVGATEGRLFGPCALGPKTPGAVAGAVDSDYPGGSRNMFISFTMAELRLETLRRVYETFAAGLAPAEEVPGFTACFCMLPIGRFRSSGNNVLGIEEIVREGKRMMVVHFAVMWQGAEADGVVEPTMCEVMERCEAVAKEAGEWCAWRYLPYAFSGQEVLERYGEEALSVIREAKKTYDPTGVWGRLVKGGFRVPE